MLATIIFLSVVGGTLPLSEARGLPQPMRQDDGLQLLGTVEGRTFYVEHEPKRTWMDARDLCMNNSMDLASILNRTQTEFLSSVNETTYLNGTYWTSAKEFMLTKAFHWAGSPAGSSDQPDISAVGSWGFWHVVPPHFCAYLGAEWDHNAGMHSVLCTEEHGTLCVTEMKNP